ncbi:hypothetical protein Tco_0406718, partial [Tanacetum coccineum]
WKLFGQNASRMFKNHREQVQSSIVRALLLDKKNQASAPAPAPAPVKAVELSCVTWRPRQVPDSL